MSGIVKTDPKDAQKINDMVRELADEIIKHIKKEQEKYFPDSPTKNDPLTISLNAYNLTMHVTNALNNQIVGLCLDMQANYNLQKEKKDE